MSYHTWTTYGIGVCVDDICGPSLSVYKILELAATDRDILDDVEDYINQFCLEEDITKDEFTIDDLDDLEGDYGERGLSYILFRVIEKEIPVVFADDFDGASYILYCPDYPWNLENKEKNLTEKDIIDIFTKYIRIITDTPVKVGYYNVSNGG